MVIKKTKKNLTLGDITYMPYYIQEKRVDEYIDSMLFGDVREYLDSKNIRIFKGISREFSNKYIIKFNEMLKLNNYEIGPLNKVPSIKYKNKKAYEYVCFFVFGHGRGNAFGSFSEAYRFSNEMVLYYNDVFGDATKMLATNADVSFGRVIIQDGEMKEKDIESVVNKDFYKVLTS
jgi:hypothetical protein